MKRVVVIVPVAGYRLYGAMVQKEVDLAKAQKGTLHRSGVKLKDKTKWSHTTYKGWINLQRSEGEVVTAVIKSRSQSSDEWQLLHAFLGFVDRHFSDKINTLLIQYRKDKA